MAVVRRLYSAVNVQLLAVIGRGNTVYPHGTRDVLLVNCGMTKQSAIGDVTAGRVSTGKGGHR